MRSHTKVDEALQERLGGMDPNNHLEKIIHSAPDGVMWHMH
jgi:hypothetical protein